MAPSGESNNESPRLPSLKPSLDFMPGIDATQMPNNKLEVANKKPTAKAGLFFMKEEKFLSMMLIADFGKVKQQHFILRIKNKEIFFYT